MKILIEIVKFIVMILALAVWSGIGFIFWIPLLTRSTILFSASILYVTLTNQNPSGLGHHLEIATIFYIEGFRKIITAMYVQPRSSFSSGINFNIWRFLLEILWTAFFWFTLMFVSGHFVWLIDLVKAKVVGRH